MVPGPTPVSTTFLEGNPVAKIKPDSVKVDMVAVTHGHFDHVADAVKIALKNSAPLVTMVELAGILQEENKDLNAVGINYSGSTTIDGVKFTSVPAFHSSGYNGKYGGSPMGIIVTDGLKVAFCRTELSRCIRVYCILFSFRRHCNLGSCFIISN